MFRRFAVNYPANKEPNLKDILYHYKIESEILSERSSDKARLEEAWQQAPPKEAPAGSLKPLPEYIPITLSA